MPGEPKVTPDPIELLQQRLAAEQLEFESRREAYTADLIMCEARIRRTEADLREAHRKLQAGESLGTLLAMPTADPLPRTNNWGRKMDDDDPLRRVGNLSAWAKKHGVSYATVKRWKTKASTGNAIPLRWATHFRKRYGVPYTYWPNGVTQEPGKD